MMGPLDHIAAARVPLSLRPQEFGLWTVSRLASHVAERSREGRPIGPWPYLTLLRRATMLTLHVDGEVVMEDSLWELRKHLPLWLIARGRVLITGLGLGCVVRGLLANPRVAHVDVVEIDAGILRVVGPEFGANPRVRLHQGDALTIDFPPGTRWDFAWHDLWEDGPDLQLTHAKLFDRYRDRVGRQGAWAFPRVGARLCRRAFGPLIGAPRFPSIATRRAA